jgi:hypothetical protein
METFPVRISNERDHLEAALFMVGGFAGRTKLADMIGEVIFPAFCCCHFMAIRLLAKKGHGSRVVEIYDSKNSGKLPEKIKTKLDEGLDKGSVLILLWSKYISLLTFIDYQTKFMEVQHQSDNHNCGLFTLQNLTSLLLGKVPNKTETHRMDKLRVFYRLFVENGFDYNKSKDILLDSLPKPEPDIVKKKKNLAKRSEVYREEKLKLLVQKNLNKLSSSQ